MAYFSIDGVSFKESLLNTLSKIENSPTFTLSDSALKDVNWAQEMIAFIDIVGSKAQIQLDSDDLRIYRSLISRAN